MEFVLWMLVLTTVFDATPATKCHDCSSWNPYCRHKVDEPFETAVAVVECDKTDTCFLKKDESGVINRGCADWWLESQVDISYVGCQTQHVPWLGEMTWCFCKQDYCNGGSIDMLSRQEYPEVPYFPESHENQEWGEYTDWEEEDWPNSEEEEWKEDGDDYEGGWGDTGRDWDNDDKNDVISSNDVKSVYDVNTFDDVIPGYDKGRKKTDRKYQLWFWHADSDRPVWGRERERGGEEWRAPQWVENHDGNGWDFPVTGTIHKHTAQQLDVYHNDDESYNVNNNDNNDNDIDYPTAPASNDDDKSTTIFDGWNWGEGWGHIKPWWLREERETGKSTAEPKRWTPHLTDRPSQQDDGYPLKSGKRTPNSVQHDVISYDVDDSNDVRDDVINYDVDGSNDVSLEVGKEDFFCWDCYSDSPLCGERVDTPMATYLGKTSCSATHRCFVRNDNGVIYRGCADGWTSSLIDTNYEGCRSQRMWNRQVEWCFCSASLCNGDSMADIQHKYSAQLEPFRASTMLADNTTQSSAAAQSTILAKLHVTDSRDKTTSHHVLKRSTTTKAHNSTITTDFHVRNETELITLTNISTETNLPTNWQTTVTGSDATEGNGLTGGNSIPGNEQDIIKRRNGTKPESDDFKLTGGKYKALAG